MQPSATPETVPRIKPRKTHAATALGYAAVGFISFALWSLVFPLIQLLLH